MGGGGEGELNLKNLSSMEEGKYEVLFEFLKEIGLMKRLRFKLVEVFPQTKHSDPHSSIVGGA